MRPRQFAWKWLLAAFALVLAAGVTLAAFNLVGAEPKLRDQVAASLSEWTGGTATLTEPLRIRYFPPSLQGGLVLSDPSKLPGIRAVTAPHFKVTLGFPSFLIGRVRLDTLQLGRPIISLNGREGTHLPSLSGLGGPLLGEMPVEMIRIRRGRIVSADGEKLIRKLDIRLKSRGRKGSLRVLGSFAFNGETVAFSLDSGKIAPSSGGSAPVTLKVSSRPLTAKFSGTMRAGTQLEATGTMEAELPKARRFLNWVGVDTPAGKSFRNISASGTAHWSGQTLTFDDGAFAFDGNEAVGLFAVTAGARPRVEGTLAFETLTLDPYLGIWHKAGKDAPLDKVLFKVLDADLRVSAGEFSARGLAIGRGGFTVSAKDGKVSTEVGELEMCKGHASGRLQLDLTGAQHGASITGGLSDVMIQRCLHPFALGLPIEGRSTLKFDLSTANVGSLEKLTRELAGEIEITAEEGVLPIDLDALAATDSAGAQGWTEGSGTAFDTLNADCSLSAGQLWCHSVRIQAPSNVVTGSGGFDVSQQMLDWDLLIADPVAPVDASVDALQEIPENTSRITVDGSLSAPRFERAKRSETDTAPASTSAAPR